MKLELINKQAIEEITDLLETAYTLSEENRTQYLISADKKRRECDMSDQDFKNLVNHIRDVYESEKRNSYNADGSGVLTIYNLEKALDYMKITVKYNVISHKIEFSGEKVKNAPKGARGDNAPTIIYDELQHYLKSCTIDKITAFLKTLAVFPNHIYNPVLDRINSVNWDNTNRLEQLYQLLSISDADTLSRTMVKKWCMQCYCGLHNSLENPFSLDMVLVFLGGQGYGKTRLLEKLAMVDFFGEGKRINPDNKDSIIQATEKWITELGEIGSTMKSDTDMLKAFISNKSDEYRAPYGRTTVEYPRMTSFCGSCNNAEYLVDETGNRRFLTVNIPDDKYIDLNGELFKNFDVLQFWAQIKSITEKEIEEKEMSYASVFRLTRDEIKQSEIRNNTHMKSIPAEDEIQDIISDMTTAETGYELTEEYMTATQFKTYHEEELQKYSARQICKALRKLGYTQVQKRIGSVSTKYFKLPHKRYVKANNFSNNSGNPYL